MMKRIDEVSVLVIDHGRYLPVAQRLARDCRRVCYWSPWETDGFSVKTGLIGAGLESIERVNDPFDQSGGEYDLIVFPNIGFSDLQAEFIRQGKAVWGARNADVLELNRGKFLAALKSVGLPVPNFERIEGLSELRLRLRERRDVWIKCSKWRGDFETMHWRSWDEDEGTLDQLACRLGPAKNLVIFYVFEPVPAVVESGIDTHCIDGQLPGVCFLGLEKKDEAYLGTITRYDEIDERTRVATDRFAPLLASYGYRSFFSTEVRVTEAGKSFFIDPTLRTGSPPYQVQCELYGNYGEILWRGAHGQCVDPEPVAKFGVQATVTSETDNKEWTEIVVPPSLERWLKVGFAFRSGARLCIPPGKNLALWLIGIGDDAAGAMAALQRHAQQLPEGFYCPCHALANLIQTARDMKAEDMPLTDQPLPSPESVLTLTHE